MDYLPQFKSYLQSHNYSPATIRNYLADISRYQAYVNEQNGRSDIFQEHNHVPKGRVSTAKIIASPEHNEHQQKSVASLQNITGRDALQCVSTKNNQTDLFSPETLKSYIVNLESDPNLGRYLSSLNKFCQFALDQQLITSNPIKHILRQLQSPPKTNLDDLLKQYQTYLTKKNKTPVTIKNYINDIRQYISFEN